MKLITENRDNCAKKVVNKPSQIIYRFIWAVKVSKCWCRVQVQDLISLSASKSTDMENCCVSVLCF